MSEPSWITFHSTLAASADQVWAHASSFAGVNMELWPLVRMTHPPEFATLAPDTIPLGKKAFRSWILLGCVLPIEFDDFRLVELEPGRSFYEISSLLTIREWRHRRTVMATAAGCEICDEIALIPRVPGTGWLLRSVYRTVYKWRHRRLRKLFRGYF